MTPGYINSSNIKAIEKGKANSFVLLMSTLKLDIIAIADRICWS